MPNLPRPHDSGASSVRSRAGLALAAIVIGLGFLPQTALAQISPGLSGSSSQQGMDGGEAMRTLRVFGSCYASRNTSDAWVLIETEPGSRQEAETYRRLFSRDTQGCLGEFTELRMPVFMVRGAIAEGLYARRVAVPQRLAIPAPAPGATVRTLSEAARCFATQHPDRVRALVANTAPGSESEHRAISEIGPDFFRCVPETARSREFSAVQIRYRLVEALLRMEMPASASAEQR